MSALNAAELLTLDFEYGGDGFIGLAANSLPLVDADYPFEGMPFIATDNAEAPLGPGPRTQSVIIVC